MAAITVNPVEIRKVEEDIRGYAAKLGTLTEELSAIVSDLASSWEGDSHEAFVAEFAKDVQQYGEFKDNVVLFADKIEEVVTTFEAAEAANVEIAKTFS